MSDPIGCCPVCGSSELILERAQPDFEMCEYLCVQCDFRGIGSNLVFKDTLNYEDDPDEDFNDTRREDWGYDQYRRIDAQDLADAEQAEFPDELDED